MTETASNPAGSDPAGKGAGSAKSAARTASDRPSLSRRVASGRGEGLPIERVYTTAGVHPYDEVTWERRDVVQTNWKTGETIFEQAGVEFPDFWSLNASTIVTTKYFRGALGADNRERSLKQLLDRVVLTYTKAGKEHGYFASEADAEVFEHELTWMLLHQVFSFNSPVWFNVGTSSPQQVSACQPYDALVSTPAGLVPIGKLVDDNAVGAKVYDAHGLTKILAVKHNGVKDVLRVHTKAGYALDVTGDHLVWKSSGCGTGGFVPAGTLMPGDRLEWHRREAFGEMEISALEISEAALAGWLQSDGFVGQYSGTNRSLTIEAMTVTDAERDWVVKALDAVFPDVHRHERLVVTQDQTLDSRRTRLYGAALGDFVTRWDLQARGVEMDVPPHLCTAPLPVVAAYLRSIFQAEGFVAARERSTVVEVDMISEKLIKGMQSLLLRFGIYARVGFKVDPRPDRHGCWSLRIQTAGDRRAFADHIGFVDPVKSDKLERSFDKPGLVAKSTKVLEIARIEQIGAMDVYDIQTESGEYLSGNLRVHNCFILAVDDSMESILNWYREEGMIFKGGSGAGLNLSRIRSSKELLRSSGGTASGPVSFMRGADASAGTIKSGGATRRAAKMVVLDVDHPDIEEFVETKAREETKIRALRDAGFDMDLGGRDITSVQYQNANNSVRVTDEFMRAVEEGTEFGLKARGDGRVLETVVAKELFGKISEAAWACADPGVQYDDTINDWHTTPESGRINASNPCSEYMHLDNSSCNLASLNLLKFLNDDGSFDAKAFVKAVEIVITAMDISICFADFPTDAIGDTTRTFRQLGIGYANLGALLMAAGKAYDSEGGRALAASITSLMTGTAYKRSAELAGVVGPYDGYARNADAHQRVMRKHAAANDAIRTMHPMDRDVHAVATKVWAEGNVTGGKSGWRNAQASVLAPTGCLTGDTLITTDRGLQRLSELGDVWGDRWQDLDAQVATDEGPQQATQFFVNGEEPTRRIVTEGGYRLQGTLTHRIKVVDPSTGEWAWKRMADIQPGDLTPMQMGGLVGEPREVPLPVLDQAYYAGDRSVVVPDAVDVDLAELVGYFMGDGSLHAKGIRFCVADTDLDVVERLRILGKGLFNLEPVVTQQQGYQEVSLSSVRLARWWKAAGFAKDLPGVDHSGKGWTPRVPAAIRETNDNDVYAAFVRGVFEADGTVLDGVPSLSTASKLFADDLRTLLLNLGFPTTTRETVSGFGGPCHQVRIRNLQWAVDFGDRIGFISERKAGRVARDLSRQSGNRDRVHLPAKELGYLFETVAANEDGGVQPTYDLSVPSNVTYVASGFVSHNTIGFMMDCDTTGIEPDFSLVKFKKLVGGGSMQIVNQTVPAALTKLGYASETIEAIVEHIAEHGHVIDAPGLKPEHYEVFDCAVGARSIKPMGHVRMMASTQPFLSGAISKCVVGDTLLTTGNGLIRIDSLHRGEDADTFRDEIIEVDSLGGPTKTDAFYYGGVRPVREVVLRSGHRVSGTPNHRVLVGSSSGLEWKYVSEVSPGDYVAQQYGSDMWSTTPADLRSFVPVAPYGSQKRVQLPTEMSEELAFLLGAYASEGHTAASTWTVAITNSVDAVLEKVQSAWQSVFGLATRIERREDKCPQVIASSKTVVEFLRFLGAGSRASDKRIPDAVLTSPREMVLAFLQGLALDAYSTSGPQAKWAICLDSRPLLDDLQAVLTNLGVVHGRITKHNAKYDKDFDEVYASGEYARQMTLLVPFLEPDKAARAEALRTRSFLGGGSDIVPFLSGRQLYEAIPMSKSGRNGKSYRKHFRHLLDPRTTHPSITTLANVAAIPDVQLPQEAYDVLWDGLHFSPAVSVSDAGEREVYDVSVPTTQAFVGNGIVNHNTVNLPSESTVEEVADVYFQGWKLGLKALAIYRDNSKVGQPLSGDKDRKDGSTEVPAPVIEYRPTRKRLPKSRPSVTTSFTVGGAEGYMTAGSYPDDGLGEVFLKLGKQGSTLAGVMDAFSIAISIALQHGVPLETYVQKFTNMRFDPAGMTDDPDVRMAQSIMDYIFRRLALDHLPFETRSALGIHSAEERARQLETGSYQEDGSNDEEDLESLAQSAPTAKAAAPETESAAVRKAPLEVHSSTELLESLQGRESDAPMCFTCGTKMRPAGSCHVCEGCGSTSGCS